MAQASLRDVVIDALEDIKAANIVELDVRNKTSITDTMVIASGTSSRHVKAASDRLLEKVKAAGFEVLGMEGEAKSDWILVDMGDVVVHLMMPEARELYRLERLWGVDDDVEREPLPSSKR